MAPIIKMSVVGMKFLVKFSYTKGTKGNMDADVIFKLSTELGLVKGGGDDNYALLFDPSHKPGDEPMKYSNVSIIDGGFGFD